MRKAIRISGQHRLVRARPAVPQGRRRTAALRAVSIVPLALLSAAWSASLLDVDGAEPATASAPDDVPVPAEAIEAPASYSPLRRVGLGVPRGSAARVVAASSRNGIPAAALAAYQRAETVIEAVDRACGLDWELVAAIGLVESDHGRYGGSTLGTDGISRPGIFGVALDGTDGTAEIADTDAGRFDRDTVFDRAVGPMQFIPSTWFEVGVDADGDGHRNPQDVDDAALASAVYLCSGADDLGTVAGRRVAVRRYNHSNAYVDLVLAVREAYLEGDYTAVPTHVTSAVTLTSDHSFPRASGGPGVKAGKPAGVSTGSGSGGPDSGRDSDSGAWGGTPAPTSPTSPPPATEPPRTPDPAPQPQETVTKIVEDTTATLDDTVTTVLSLPQAILACTGEGFSALLTPTQWSACIHGHTS